MPEIRLLRQNEEAPPDLEALKSTSDQASFFQAAFELAAAMARLAREVVDQSWAERPGRNEGILRGLVVRVVKYVDRLVAASAENNGEVQFAFERMTLETLVNLGYLLSGPDGRYDEFVWDSMVTARARRETIRANIEARGEPLAIETRQLRAIEHEAALAGCDLNRPVRECPRLPPFEQRSQHVFTQGSIVYDFGYRSGSAGIHGSWKDMLDRHVSSDGRFEPIFEWRHADPTPILGITVIGSAVLSTYAGHVRDAERADHFLRIANTARDVNGVYGPVYEAARDNDSD